MSKNGKSGRMVNPFMLKGNPCFGVDPFASRRPGDVSVLNIDCESHSSVEKDISEKKEEVGD